MKRLSITFILFAILILVKESYSFSPIINPALKSSAQGGLLEFSTTTVEKYSHSIQNSDLLVLRNYTGRPLKALQFKIVIGKDGGKLNFKSISRGTSIPESSFLLDYEVHKGELQPDGSSIDVVSVVLLGWGENVLYPEDLHNIVLINYDIVEIDGDSSVSHLCLTDVKGATITPVEDANILAGEEQTIFLKRAPVENDLNVILLQNFPNPFNPATTISFKIPENDQVCLKVFNSIGQEISTLIDEYKTAGNYSIAFNAANLTSGVYFYQVRTTSYTIIKKMMLVK